MQRRTGVDNGWRKPCARGSPSRGLRWGCSEKRPPDFSNLPALATSTASSRGAHSLGSNRLRSQKARRFAPWLQRVNRT